MSKHNTGDIYDTEHTGKNLLQSLLARERHYYAWEESLEKGAENFTYQTNILRPLKHSFNVFNLQIHIHVVIQITSSEQYSQLLYLFTHFKLYF